AMGQDLGTGFGQMQGDMAPDAVGRAGDENGLARECHGSLLPRGSCRCCRGRCRALAFRSNRRNRRRRLPMRPFLISAMGLLCLAPGALADEALLLSRGQTIYAPVYSEILHGNLSSSGKASRLPLSAMLSIRNTNPGAAITVTSVKYYDSAGKMLQEY